MEKPILVIIQFAVFAFAISVHESAHAWMANKCGDPTARFQGRITLNPIAHIDLFGTIIFPLMLALIGAPVFGWAKPVPVNPYNFRKYRRDTVLVSAAGPGSNLLIAGITSILFLVFKNFEIYQTLNPTIAEFIGILFLYTIIINIYLMVFNLIPVPPLDGSGILDGTLRGKALYEYQKLKPYGFIILIVIVYTGVLDYIARPIFAFVYNILIRG